MRKDSVVMKFGGFPMSLAELIAKAAEMVQANPDCQCVVVSAPGRIEGLGKVTDALIACHKAAVSGQDFEPWLNEIETRFNQITEELSLQPLTAEFDQLREQLHNGSLNRGWFSWVFRRKPLDYDWVVSRGEFLMATVMARLLGAIVVPVEQLIVIDDNGQVLPESYERLATFMKGDRRYVLPGFYGCDKRGKLKLLDRGGSDITAAVAAKALKARLYMNVKDVPGVAMADPSIVEDPSYFKEITYRFMYELASRGASVLHPGAVAPAEEAGIPILICSIVRPDLPGTLIMPDKGEENSSVGFAGKVACTGYRIYRAGMDDEVGIGERALAILRKLGISFSYLATGEQDIVIVIPTSQIRGQSQEIVDQLSSQLKAEVTFFSLAIVSVVAPQKVKNPDFLSKVFQALSLPNVSIYLSDVGSRSIIIGIDPDQYQAVIRSLYRQLL